jgi:ligand-binding SRPBCC domain-containing protein
VSLYSFEQTQKIPASLEAVWEFMATPRNLMELTPAYMDFRVTSPDLPDKIFLGQLISYTVKPLLGIKLKWITEITKVKALDSFIDVQKSGPYKFWHHHHQFKKINGGVLMEDSVTYQAPLGLIGSIANSLLIRKKLKDLFIFRRQKLEEIFGVFEEPGNVSLLLRK